MALSSLRHWSARNRTIVFRRLHFDWLEDRFAPATLTVNAIDDSSVTGDQLVSLREAFAAANQSGTTDLGQTGTGNDTIVFAPGVRGRISFSNATDTTFGRAALVVQTGKSIVIDGTANLNNIIISVQSPNLRVFNILSGGSLTLIGVTVSEGRVVGGDGGDGEIGSGGGGGGAGLGGAIFNAGTLTIRDCLFRNNSALGGAGGTTTAGTTGGSGGGGGGIGGSGASGADFSSDAGAGGGGNVQDGNGASGGSNGGGSGAPGANGGGGGLGGGGAGGGFQFVIPNIIGFNGGAGGFGGGGGGAGGSSNGGTGGAAGWGAGAGAGKTPGAATFYGGTASATNGGGGGAFGGAIFNNGGNVSIVGSTFTGNFLTAGAAGGAGASAGATRGGAIYNRDGVLTISHSTFFDNVAEDALAIASVNDDNHAGGDTTSNNSASMNVTNSIAYNPGNVAAFDIVLANFSGGGISTLGGEGNLVGRMVNHIPFIASTADPQLGPLADNGGSTYTLLPALTSPARNLGVNRLVTQSTDARGLPRILDSVVDIGAVERSDVAGPYIVNSANDLLDGLIGAGNLSLREALTLAQDRAGADSISFAENLGGQTITLRGRELAINHSVTITGPGANKLAIDAATISRVFVIDGSNNVAIQDLTMTRGGSGGALVNQGATVNLNRVAITSSGDGQSYGGVANLSGGLSIVGSTISGNQAFNGGGIYNNAPLIVVNCTLSGNMARNGGGIMLNSGSIYSAQITNSTVSGNVVGSGDGGGVFTFIMLSLFNTIIAGNIAQGPPVSDDIFGTVHSTSANNLIGDAATSGGMSQGTNGNIVGNNGSGTLPIASILNTALADNGGPTRTHALVQNSLAISAASASAPGYLAYDQRDAARDPTAPDIGAYEVQHPLAPVGTPSTYARTFQPKPSAGANEAFVKGLYQSTLLRPPDPAGLANWVAQLAGGANRAEIAFGFVNSVENRSNQVTFFYKYFLGRSPDPAGLAGWVNVLQAGADEGTVMSGFLLSPEFTGQNDNASFVNLMYYALLGRQADPAGFNDWVAQLNSGQSTRDQVGNGFLRSIESITRVVVADFGSYLKRTITSSAASPYVSQIGAGVTFGRVAAGILGADEFFVAAGQNLT